MKSSRCCPCLAMSPASSKTLQGMYPTIRADLHPTFRILLSKVLYVHMLHQGALPDDLTSATHMTMNGQLGIMNINRVCSSAQATGKTVAITMQGLRRHLQMPHSFATPLCHIPTGSGNGIAATCGLWTPITAAHAIVKGNVRPMDAASVNVASESVPRLAILSIQYGLLPDLDIGTEHLRKVCRQIPP